jgi:hypothetical protein
MNALLPLLMLLVSWSVDTNDKEVQSNIFKIFVCVHIGVLASMGFLFFRVMFGAKQTGTVVVSIQSHSNDPKERGKTETISVQDYDARKLRELCLQKIMMPLGIMIFIYSKWGTVLPLLFQCVNNPSQLYKHELFQIYIMGKEPKFELARPWTEPNPMPEWLQKLSGASENEAPTANKKKH